ncbi:hypothetical protein GW17_00024528 [Ensete ventricosum]|nr:hypothetical protein GW17_00024528 [Ensete ventricosum]
MSSNPTHHFRRSHRCALPHLFPSSPATPNKRSFFEPTCSPVRDSDLPRRAFKPFRGVLDENSTICVPTPTPPPPVVFLDVLLSIRSGRVVFLTLICTSADQKPISWYTRMKIAYGTAQGLEFLHEKADPPVIYRELKPSNILLDEDFNPKLSDIGLAKGDKVHVSSMVMDTNGYSSPEYTRTGQLTLKSDVYSFGVVMLELITGRSVMDTNEPNLVAWLLPIGGATMEASLRLLPAATVQLRVGLVVDDVKWQRPGSLRLSVVLPQHRLRGRGLKRRIKKEVSVPVTLPWRKRKRGRMDAHCFYEIVVWDLREEVVDDMSSDVVVDVVYPPVVSVDRRQSSTQIAPLLRDGEKKVV